MGDVLKKLPPFVRRRGAFGQFSAILRRAVSFRENSARFIGKPTLLFLFPMKLPTLIFFLAVIAVARSLAAEVEHKNAHPSALGQLQALWRQDLSKRPQFKKFDGALSIQIYENARIKTVETSGAEVAQRIEALGTKQRSLILTGNVEALRQAGEVTEVLNPGTIKNGFAAYFDKDGNLVLFLIIPEG
jgi:hypothetical protein